MFLAVAPLHALTINITSFAAQPGNSGQGTIEAWLSTLVTGYNAANNPDLPAPGLELFRQNSGAASPGLPSGFPTFGNDTLSIAIPGGYEYIGLHWGGQGGGTYEAFYVGGTANVFNAPGKNGLSWYDGFLRTPGTSVPDSGSTLALLAVAGALMVSLRRKLSR